MSLAGIFDTYYPEKGSDFDFDYMEDSSIFGAADTSFSGFFGMGDDEAAGRFSDDDYLREQPFEGNILAYDRGDPTTPTIYDQGFVQYEGSPDYKGERSLAQQAKDFLFDTLGVGEETAKAISAFASAAQRGGGKQAQAQGRGRTGPALPTSARAPTTPAGRTSRARQATSGERAVQAAISQSNRAMSAAQAVANQMARAGTVTTTNDLADMISGATSPKGTKQALPGTRLRQLAIPRTA
tara:strand:- start:427 stop:1146 length:720 start_codon:yes stop_codon:yes gene_type:complete